MGASRKPQRLVDEASKPEIAVDDEERAHEQKSFYID